MACHIIFGLPGAGKTTVATIIAQEAIRSGRNVFSNYPIHYKNVYSKIWKRNYVYEVIHNSVIIIDEGYIDYSSKMSGVTYGKTIDGNFTKDEHTMFATSRHNGNDIYIIAQNWLRINTIVREISVLWKCESFRIPGTDFVVAIRVTSYPNEESMKTTSKDEPGFMWYFRIPYMSKVSMAFRSFDTHYFKKKGEMRTDLPSWKGDEDIDAIIENCKVDKPGVDGSPGRILIDDGIDTANKK